jgi:Ran GTPase-activating protein (RanGAP) involved in mRNA processing and transport
MKGCHSLKYVALKKLSRPFYVSVLKNGLCGHPSLQQLQLSELSNSDVNIALALRHTLDLSGPHLKSLTFCDSHFSRAMMNLIMNGLMHHPTVETLTMENCRFCDMGSVREFARLLKSSANKIHSLDLNQTQLDVTTLGEILTPLHHNTTLRHLNLWECGLADDISVGHVQTLFQHNKTIAHIDLGANEFGTSGATLLAEGIQNLTQSSSVTASV